jgi:hypothetical protein
MLKAEKSGVRRGFVAGFSSPYTAVFGGRFRVTTQAHDLVSTSWARVGRAIQAAIESEEQAHGQADQAGSRKH